MNSLVISPFWQSVDEHWIGTTLIAISVVCLISTALFVARYRSVSFFLISSAFLFFAAVMLAPIADSRSPKMFQLWLMSPQTLTSLSILQILISSLAVFGSIRLEVHKPRSQRLLYRICAWLTSALAALPSPVLIVFIFWLEQNMIITTRDEYPMMIGLKIAAFATGFTLVISSAALFLSRFNLISLHLFTVLFLILSGSLLPCLTVKLSTQSPTSGMLQGINAIGALFIAAVMIAMILFGIIRRKHRLRNSISER